MALPTGRLYSSPPPEGNNPHIHFHYRFIRYEIHSAADGLSQRKITTSSLPYRFNEICLQFDLYDK